jgi:hypothetical protein
LDQRFAAWFPLAVVLRGSTTTARGRIVATRDEPLGSARGLLAKVKEVFHTSYCRLTSGSDLFHLAEKDATGQLSGVQTQDI